MYPALYTAKVYDNIERKTEIVKGITFADTFTTAMENIEGYYGDTLISVELELEEESSIWELEVK